MKKSLKQVITTLINRMKYVKVNKTERKLCAYRIVLKHGDLLLAEMKCICSSKPQYRIDHEIYPVIFQFCYLEVCRYISHEPINFK